MRVVVDSNILFAAAIREGVTANLLTSDGFQFYSPTFLLDELEKHREMILSKTARSPEQFTIFLHIFRQRVEWVDRREWGRYENEAAEISPDAGDIPFFAVALREKAPIWSNDKILKKQKRIHVFSTEELLKMLQ